MSEPPLAPLTSQKSIAIHGTICIAIRLQFVLQWTSECPIRRSLAGKKRKMLSVLLHIFKYRRNNKCLPFVFAIQPLTVLLGLISGALAGSPGQIPIRRPHTPSAQRLKKSQEVVLTSQAGLTNFQWCCWMWDILKIEPPGRKCPLFWLEKSEGKIEQLPSSEIEVFKARFRDQTKGQQVRAKSFRHFFTLLSHSGVHTFPQENKRYSNWMAFVKENKTAKSSWPNHFAHLVWFARLSLLIQ